jgi:tetratricopeptide (TPR) repeat protein
MKLTEKAYNFAQKILKLAPETTSNENKTDSNANVKDAHIKDPSRIIGTTDYKKYEQMSKDIALEELTDDPKTKEAFKMGCNNDLRKQRQLFDKPSKDKIDAARIFKNEGDEFLKQKKWNEANNCYEKGLLQLFYTFSNDKEEDRKVDLMKLSLNMNMAMCKMNLNKYEEAIGYCTEALRVDKENIKAIYRIAYCYLQMDKYEDMKKYVDMGLKIQPDNKEFKGLIDMMNNKIKQEEDNSKKLFKKIIK